MKSLHCVRCKNQISIPIHHKINFIPNCCPSQTHVLACVKFIVPLSSLCFFFHLFAFKLCECSWVFASTLYVFMSFVRTYESSSEHIMKFIARLVSFVSKFCVLGVELFGSKVACDVGISHVDCSTTQSLLCTIAM